jgi:fatty acid desaturase/predicted heme/steroid binding protein
MSNGAHNKCELWMEDEGVAKKVRLDDVLYACSNKKKKVRTMTMNEVAESNTKGEVLVVIKGKVYDIKRFAQYHPGGIGPLFHGAGKDMTDAFVQFHSLNTWKRLNFFYLADMAEADMKKRNDEALQQDWDQLVQNVLSEGLYESSYVYYLLVTLRCFAFLGASLACTLGYLGDSITIHMVGALMLGMWFQQAAFVGHDTGHNGITHNSTIDAGIGLLFGNLFTGIGIGWWKKSHNNHHICCNSIDGDADIQHMPFVACNPKIVSNGPFWSSYFDKVFNATEPVTRALLSIQHIIYYPAIIGFARYNLYIQTFIHILLGRSLMPKLEVVFLTVFWAWYITLIATLPTITERCLFVFLSNSMAGILNIQITLSHFCMEVYYGSPYNHDKGIEDGWVHTQLKTTLAIVNPPWMDWFHGGLQFQDVHHLFPRMPRHNLRALRPRIKALCRKHGIGEMSPEVSFFEANVMTMKLLKETAVKVSKLKYVTPGEIKRSPLWDTLHAKG